MGCFDFCKRNDSYTPADNRSFMPSNPTGMSLFPVFFSLFAIFCFNIFSCIKFHTSFHHLKSKVHGLCVHKFLYNDNLNMLSLTFYTSYISVFIFPPLSWCYNSISTMQGVAVIMAETLQ